MCAKPEIYSGEQTSPDKPFTVVDDCYLLNKFFTNCMRAFSIFDSNNCTNKKSSNCSKYTEKKINLIKMLLTSETNKKVILTLLKLLIELNPTCQLHIIAKLTTCIISVTEIFIFNTEPRVQT